MNGEDVATCPSCSLMLKVIYDIVSTFAIFMFLIKCISNVLMYLSSNITYYDYLSVFV